MVKQLPKHGARLLRLRAPKTSQHDHLSQYLPKFISNRVLCQGYHITMLVWLCLDRSRRETAMIELNYVH